MTPHTDSDYIFMESLEVLADHSANALDKLKGQWGDDQVRLGPALNVDLQEGSYSLSKEATPGMVKIGVYGLHSAKDATHSKGPTGWDGKKCRLDDALVIFEREASPDMRRVWETK